MARIRSIKPEFFLHEDLTRLSALHRILFIGLWTQADRAGRLEDRPRRLKVQLLPYDNCDIDAMLDDLDSAGFIHRYVADTVEYLSLPAFLTHQRPRDDEQESVIPAPPERRSKPRGEVSPNQIVTAPVAQPSLGSDGPVSPQCLGKEGKGEGKGEGSMPKAEAFVALWNEATFPPIGRCRDLTPKRRKQIASRLRERSLLEWREVFARIEASDFCRGAKGDWRASFDWIVENADNAVKVLEGKYDNRSGPTPITAAEPWWAECQRLGHTPQCANLQWHQVVCARAEGAA